MSRAALIGVLSGIYILSGVARGAPVANEVHPLLEPFLGRKVIIDIPDFAGFDTDVRAPESWAVLKANDKTVDALLHLVGSPATPAVGYVDPHGNVIHVDASERCRARKQLGQGLREYDRRIEQLKRTFAQDLKEAEKARERGRDAREIQHLVHLDQLGVRGYPEVRTARRRLDELERDRRREFYHIMASEGLVKTSELIEQLKELQKRSRDLPVERRWIRRQLGLLERSAKDVITVRPRSPQ